MFHPKNRSELRRVNIASLITCIYLPILFSIVCYKGALYSVGKGSSFYILVLLFVAEVLKSFFLFSDYGVQGKRARPSRTSALDIIKLALGTITAVLILFVGVLLMGGPVADAHEETLMLAMLAAILILFPLFLHCGIEVTIQMIFGSKTVPNESITEMLMDHSLLTFCATWLSAAVISLDWNKPWQVWPIPCYLGCLAGYLVSNVIIALRVTLVTSAQKYPCLRYPAKIMQRLHIEN